MYTTLNSDLMNAAALALIICAFAVAVMRDQFNKRARVIADASTLCSFAISDLAIDYEVARSFGMSAKSAKARIRAICKQRYNLAPEYARHVLNQAIERAEKNMDRKAIDVQAKFVTA